MKTELQQPIERRILATKWLWFWTFIKLPISFSIVIIMGIFYVLFQGSAALIFSLFFLLPGIFYLIVWIGLIKKKKWAWNLNWIILLLDAVIFITGRAFGILDNRIILGYIIGGFGAFFWVALNYIYFKKREALFS